MDYIPEAFLGEHHEYSDMSTGENSNNAAGLLPNPAADPQAGMPNSVESSSSEPSKSKAEKHEELDFGDSQAQHIRGLTNSILLILGHPSKFWYLAVWTTLESPGKTIVRSPCVLDLFQEKDPVIGHDLILGHDQRDSTEDLKGSLVLLKILTSEDCPREEKEACQRRIPLPSFELSVYRVYTHSCCEDHRERVLL
ncbi:hypothetical protein MKW98_008581 [Papaver atlanticum]|uniref:Uncharacterized protein n=1 Tax=Papaver atlanticum TaxID=357466 RepID=A0AAD4TEA0_9MAGN|nr:hypothetical protein MKW98_008581 [Papaver atlanticum]